MNHSLKLRGCASDCSLLSHFEEGDCSSLNFIGQLDTANNHYIFSVIFFVQLYGTNNIPRNGESDNFYSYCIFQKITVAACQEDVRVIVASFPTLKKETVHHSYAVGQQDTTVTWYFCIPFCPIALYE